MPDTFFISDQHFNHKKFLTFQNEDGQFIRPFPTVRAMNEHIIESHNKVVGPNDTVIMLGDVGWYFNDDLARLIWRLNGHKHLCLGNHDNANWLFEHFKSVHMWYYLREHSIIASHVPMNRDDMRRVKLNVHGHVHEKYVQKDGSYGRLTPYSISKVHMNVCVEAVDYKPVALDDILSSSFYKQ